ncbi:hypothetical protein CsSME_00007892 [Camellia sinensis var. sinensis]
MCVPDAEQVTEGIDNLGLSDQAENHNPWSLHSELLQTQMEIAEKDTSCDQITLGNSFPVSVQFFDLFALVQLQFHFVLSKESFVSKSFLIMPISSHDCPLKLCFRLSTLPRTRIFLHSIDN